MRTSRRQVASALSLAGDRVTARGGPWGGHAIVVALGRVPPAHRPGGAGFCGDGGAASARARAIVRLAVGSAATDLVVCLGARGWDASADPRSGTRPGTRTRSGTSSSTRSGTSAHGVNERSRLRTEVTGRRRNSVLFLESP